MVLCRKSGVVFLVLITGLLMGLCACGAKSQTRMMEVTSYCGCPQCCGWERGSWKCLKLDFWNRYNAGGPNAGAPYSGLTASGTKPREPRPGLFSVDSLVHPWMIPVRIVFFPWLFMPQDGTIAADTRYHAFGTRMYIPGYGYGVVEDRGSAIKGPNRLDVFYKSHHEALQWGRRKVNVTIYP
ncbi:MAG: 3D domain-containing protein [Desulfosalsimonas sp.]